MRKHGFSAILLLALIVLSVFSWLQFFGQRVNIPMQNGPEFVLNTSEGSNIGVATLPDLLNGDKIPLDVNPTENLGLLGGPSSQSGQIQNNQNIRANDELKNMPIGSKIIFIDGKPIEKAASLGGFASPLTKVPIQGLTRMSPFGRVPTILANGQTVLKSYNRPFKPVSGQKYIALIIGGLGLDVNITQRAIDDLPAEISLSFAAQTPDLQTWINKARAKGHEVLIELPMANDSFDASSADTVYTLNTQSPHSANIRNLDYLLSRAEGYFAVTNYGGEVLLKDTNALSPIFSHLENAGLGFIYDGSIAGSRITNVAKTTELPLVNAYTMLDDNSHSKNKVQSQISKLPAREDDILIGMGFSYAGTLDGVLAWLQSPNGVKLAPASSAFRAQ